MKSSDTEFFIPNAFVLEREVGVLETVNCTAEHKDGKLIIDYSSPLIERVHINLQKSTTVEVVPQNKTYKNQKGLVWLGGIPEELKTL